MAHTSLTIYLLAEGTDHRATAAGPASVLNLDGDVRMHEVPTLAKHHAQLYVAARKPKPPKWASYFVEDIESTKLGKVAYSAAVLLLRVSRRVFAVSFGHGRFLIRPEVVEERFGLRVVLNSIEPDKIRSLDKKTFDAIDRNTRSQSSHESNALAYGFDVEQDLLRAATGTPTDTTLGSRLSGMDSLHVAADAELPELPALLRRYLEQYGTEAYLEAFPWVDNILPVKDEATLDTLNGRLVDELNSARGKADNQSDFCWLAIPDVIDWTRVDGFRYGPRGATHHDLHLPGFIGTLGEADTLSTELLHRRHVSAVDGDGNELERWTVYKTLHFETSDAQSTFLLTAGKWYVIKNSYVAAVNDAYDAIPTYGGQLPDYDDRTEGDYCVRVAAGSAGQLALMDRKLIRIDGASSPIEFCDLYSRDRSLIHVKRYGGSNVLSHLFAQGLVSAEAFRSDVEVVRKANEHLPADLRLEERIPRAEDFCVTFAVVSESEKPLRLPFLSRVTLRHAVRRLTAYGYRVALAKILVARARSRLQRLPPARGPRRSRRGRSPY